MCSSRVALIALSNRSMQRNSQESLEAKLKTLDDKLEQSCKIQEGLIAKLQDTVENGISHTVSAWTTIQSDLKLGWFFRYSQIVEPLSVPCSESRSDFQADQSSF